MLRLGDYPFVCVFVCVFWFFRQDLYLILILVNKGNLELVILLPPTLEL